MDEPPSRQSHTRLPAPPRPCLVLYDGACGWCTGWVAWLARRDPGRRFAFAPLSGSTARPYVGDTPPTDTMVLVERRPGGARLFTHSEAVLRTMRRLGGVWRTVAAVLTALPRPLTDFGYRLVAKRRHALPARAGACALPGTTASGDDLFLP